MCLITTQKYPKIAFWNIKVKKRIEKFNDSWYTPVALCKLENNQKILKPKRRFNLIKLISGLCGRKGLNETFLYGDGFIHSFGKMSGWNLVENTKTIKSIHAIIPFGSLYYYDAKNDEYCSTKLKLIWNEEK